MKFVLVYPLCPKIVLTISTVGVRSLLIPLRLVFLANPTKTDFRGPKVELEADPSSSGVRLYPENRLSRSDKACCGFSHPS